MSKKWLCVILMVFGVAAWAMADDIPADIFAPIPTVMDDSVYGNVRQNDLSVHTAEYDPLDSISGVPTLITVELNLPLSSMPLMIDNPSHVGNVTSSVEINIGQDHYNAAVGLPEAFETLGFQIDPDVSGSLIWVVEAQDGFNLMGNSPIVDQ